MTARCACGRPLHYRKPAIESYVQQTIERLGPMVPIKTASATWLVPRHYLVLHGISVSDLPRLAAAHGWKRIRR
jgi:hypothetical protein